MVLDLSAGIHFMPCARTTGLHPYKGQDRCIFGNDNKYPPIEGVIKWKRKRTLIWKLGFSSVFFLRLGFSKTSR